MHDHTTTTDGLSTAAAAAGGFPPCPTCKDEDGVLLPMNSGQFWVCTAPSCTYTISGYGAAVTYYKGHALTEKKEKSGKRWVEFKF
ncbi:MAG: hypothetical protein AAF907_11750 [Planctomycetota bacterium]